MTKPVTSTTAHSQETAKRSGRPVTRQSVKRTQETSKSSAQEQLEKKVETVKDNMKKLKEQGVALQKENKEMKNQVTELKEQKVALQEENKEMENQVTELETKCSELEQRWSGENETIRRLSQILKTLYPVEDQKFSTLFVEGTLNSAIAQTALLEKSHEIQENEKEPAKLEKRPDLTVETPFIKNIKQLEQETSELRGAVDTACQKTATAELFNPHIKTLNSLIERTSTVKKEAQNCIKEIQIKYRVSAIPKIGGETLTSIEKTDPDKYGVAEMYAAIQTHDTRLAELLDTCEDLAIRMTQLGENIYEISSKIGVATQNIETQELPSPKSLVKLQFDLSGINILELQEKLILTKLETLRQEITKFGNNMRQQRRNNLYASKGADKFKEWYSEQKICFSKLYGTWKVLEPAVKQLQKHYSDNLEISALVKTVPTQHLQCIGIVQESSVESLEKQIRDKMEQIEELKKKKQALEKTLCCVKGDPNNIKTNPGMDESEKELHWANDAIEAGGYRFEKSFKLMGTKDDELLSLLNELNNAAVQEAAKTAPIIEPEPEEPPTQD